MHIEPNPNVMSHKTGTLHGLTQREITQRLGFGPNVMDDESKVAFSWGFTLDGVDCAVWDWKGSHYDKKWSAFGPHDRMRELFGNHYSGGQYDSV